MDNLQQLDNFPPLRILRIDASFFIEDGKYYKEVQQNGTSNEGSIRLVDVRKWIEKPFPLWMIRKN